MERKCFKRKHSRKKEEKRRTRTGSLKLIGRELLCISIQNILLSTLVVQKLTASTFSVRNFTASTLSVRKSSFAKMAMIYDLFQEQFFLSA